MYQSGVVPSTFTTLGLGEFLVFFVFIVFPQIPKVFPKFPMCSLRSSQQHFIFYPMLLGHASISTYITCKRGPWVWYGVGKGKALSLPFWGREAYLGLPLASAENGDEQRQEQKFWVAQVDNGDKQMYERKFCLANEAMQHAQKKRGSQVLKIDRIMYVYTICQT